MSVETIGADTATTLATQLTAPGVINTKSAWTQISASTSASAQSMVVFILASSAEGDVLIDIGTGGAGAETVVVPNIVFHGDNTRNISTYFVFPVAISSGTRVAARYQSTSTTTAVFVTIYLCNNTNSITYGSCAATGYGQATADSGGTSVDPGGTINTKGNYSQLSASTGDDIDWCFVHFGIANNAAPATSWWMVDIATGAAASETVVIPNIIAHTHSAVAQELTATFWAGPFPVSIASGTRLAARAQCLQNDATDRLIDVSVIGYNGTAASGGGASFGAYIK